MKIPIVEDILSANDRLAAENARLLADKGLLAVNIMASPGAGKTSLIVQTIDALRDHTRLGVIEGDIADERMYSEAQVQTRIEAFVETLNAGA